MRDNLFKDGFYGDPMQPNEFPRPPPPGSSREMGTNTMSGGPGGGGPPPPPGPPRPETRNSATNTN